VNRFITRHASKIIGVLKGFDRLLFRGHLRRLNFAGGVEAFLRRQGVLKKHFGAFAEHITDMIRHEADAVAKVLRRPSVYLASSTVRKEDVARRLLREHPVDAGQIRSCPPGFVTRHAAAIAVVRPRRPGMLWNAVIEATTSKLASR